MKQKIFSVFDSAAQAYLPPFCLHNRGMAIRVFGDMVARPEHAFAMHPADYTVFELGEFDDATGMFVLLDGPEKVIGGLEVVAPVVGDNIADLRMALGGTK